MEKIGYESLLKDYKGFQKLREDRQIKISSADFVKPASFEDIFTNLSNCIFIGDLDLSGLKLSSLKGCPAVVENGHIDISDNEELENLDFFPSQLDFSRSLYVDYYVLQLLKGVSVESYKGCAIAIHDHEFGLSDFEKSKNICIALSDLRKVNGDFKNVLVKNPVMDYAEIEKLYKIYEKVDFNQEKLDRALELL